MLLREGKDVASDLFQELGDFSFWDPSHHGTPSERRQAILAGYQVGRQNLSLERAYELGAEYIVENFFNPRAYPKCYGEGKLRYYRICGSCHGNRVRSCGACKGEGVLYYRGRDGYLYRSTCTLAKGMGGSDALPAEGRACAFTLISALLARAMVYCWGGDGPFLACRFLSGA